MKSLNEMTTKEFMDLPSRKWGENIGEFNSIIIIPSRLTMIGIIKYNIVQFLNSKISWLNSFYLPNGLHDSGYRTMDFVACTDSKPIIRLSGCSDVIEFTNQSKQNIRIDCLKKSGLLHVFAHGKMTCGVATSTFNAKIEDI